ncbi:hypothetical protein KAFR_0H01100 [Kazachstania africana CBS 2517]|uniref:AP-2 complex subunit alpha n=1 Tax=Kazachstania africana (strain ATCC 22294 / BCRC 22015 / CBS 2517 / CECT 1963 / NBRC 1671 / NRRL Y-8276) TaxID=1071382 RepID=H2AYW4_KAZAF|nr:hypothetical protein KAFR_0H01100 [Kazachstania africana CBS 2517]CCF59520.1 hypothetical protein KAFR_0H01100 [Kazachstania africana CBS 2517]
MERRKSFLGNTGPSTGTTIKGLQLFIADLRASQHSQDQEKRIQSEIFKVKQYFNSSSGKKSKDKLDGYQRKKYILKLAYIYITSNTSKLDDIIFALRETLELTRANTFSEKFTGYMTLSLLFQHKQVSEELDADIMNQLIIDLSANNENYLALALNFIGTCGSVTPEFGLNEDLVTHVFQVLRSPTSTQYLKKKAALAFLTLIKGNPTILTDNAQRKQIWIQRILSLLDDKNNYRLTLTVLPLVRYIADKLNPSYCKRLIPQLAEILYNSVVVGTSPGSNFPTEYKFANMPNPWLILKIVSLLNSLIISPRESSFDQIAASGSQFIHINEIDSETLGKLRMCVMQAIDLASRKSIDMMERLVQNTILFSLINFASKLDPSEDAIVNAVNILCSLLESSEINVRYLTLDSLVKLCSFSGKTAVDTVCKDNLDSIFYLLNTERDPSIVKKVIDLLFTFTNVDNIKTIVENLLKFLGNSKNFATSDIKSDLLVKLAVFTERYATDSNWFVETTLKLLSLSDIASLKDEEVWHRLCQIVVNNPELRIFACEKLVDYLQENQTSEPILKSAAFIIGEYGDLISEKVTIPKLFNLFTDKYFASSNLTKAMILTTMMQLYKFQPEISSHVIKFFQIELNSLDIELQRRSFEYLKLIQVVNLSANINLLNLLFAPQPPFNSKSNPLLKRLAHLPSTSNSNNNASASSLNLNSRTLSAAEKEASVTPTIQSSRQSHSSSALSVESIKALDSYYVQQKLVSNWREGFSRMIHYKQGILFISPLMKIIYRINDVGLSQLSIVLTYINQTEWDITGLSTEIIPSRTQDNPEYIISKSEVPSSSTIAPHKRVGQTVEVVIRKPYSIEESPIININFRCGGSSNSMNLKLGLGVTATMKKNSESPGTSLQQFVTRWKTLRDALDKDGEYHLMSLKISEEHKKTDSSILVFKTLERMGFEMVEKESISNTLFATGVIHTKTDGNFGCLIKIQYLEENGTVSITGRTTTPGPLAKYIVDCIRHALVK